MSYYAVSVIVPIYNSERTIHRCVDSLLNQTIPIEIILVNDGSKDKSFEICSEYSRKYDNIIFINQSNCGVSHARNVGIEKASSKYVGFVDSDDFVDKYMFEKMLDCYSGDVSIVMCSLEDDNRNVISLSYSDTIKCILCDSAIRGYPWNKLFKTDILRTMNIRFSEQIDVMEDKLFCLSYMNEVYGGGIILNEKLYFYDGHDSCFAGERYSLEKYKTGLNACDAILNLDCIKKNRCFEDIQKCLYVKHCVQIARKAIRLDQDISEYKNRTRGYERLYFRSSNIGIKQKVGLIILRVFPALLKWF